MARRATEANLRAMDERFGLWGWKSPRGLFSIHNWVSMVRNPMFVLIWRDQIQTTRSVVSRERLEFEVAPPCREVYAELARSRSRRPFRWRSWITRSVHRDAHPACGPTA